MPIEQKHAEGRPMSEFNGLAHVEIDGEEIQIKHIDITTDLSDKEVFGHNAKECDMCGGLVPPLKMLIVAGTDKSKVGTYHIGCYNE